MQGKAPSSSSEILQAATHYSSVIPAEVYITMPDVVPISLALHHKSVGRNVKPMWAGTSRGKDRMKQKGRKGADTTLGSIDIADVGPRHAHRTSGGSWSGSKRPGRGRGRNGGCFCGAGSWRHPGDAGPTDAHGVC
jgi:hypothetical protein